MISMNFIHIQQQKLHHMEEHSLVVSRMYFQIYFTLVIYQQILPFLTLLLPIHLFLI